MMDRSVSFWMMVPIGFLELIFGMRVRVSGDEIEYGEPALIIMNHRTRLDWMYMWSALYQINPWLITSNKISLKVQLQSLPGAGFGMSAAQFLFLHRNKEKDAATFDEAVAYYKNMENSYQVLLFPEGTDKSPWTTTKSSEYAKKNGLKELKNLLYPRVAGFFHLLTKMREANFVTYVYDVSIAYPYNIVQSEVS
ncbi:Acyltransferase [Cooperia oncophora]